MKVFQIIVDFFTSFVITSGGAMAIAMYVSKGVPLSREAWVFIVGLGVVQGAKNVRNLMNLPPMNNGNYAALKEFMEAGKARRGDTDIVNKPKP